jgi:DNA-binding HxlR family transcriptional regulator
MRWDSLDHEQCSVARTVAVIGDRWSILVLRECFLRVRRFEEFQSRLGAPRHILADRLKKLVHFGVLRRSPYQEKPMRHEYILTQRGLELYPVMCIGATSTCWMNAVALSFMSTNCAERCSIQ